MPLQLRRPVQTAWRTWALLCAALGALGTPSAQPAGDIAYLNGPNARERTVCVLHLDSREVDEVGVGPDDGRPVWSPNGMRLAHTFGGAAGRAIRVIDADGENPVELPSVGASSRQPRWSPDGARIAFVAGAPNAEQIHVFDWATGSVERWGVPAIPLIQFAWVSADRLVAVGRVGSPGSQTTDLFWVTRTRTDRIVDAMPEYGEYFEWAPDSPGFGDFLAFESDDGGDREIFVYAPQRGAIDVSNHRAADWNPKWSPDRRTLAFESFRSGRRGIYRVNALRVLVDTIRAPAQADAWDPDFSPNGAWIVFVSDENGDADLFVARVDGSDVSQITDAPGLQCAPAWRPAE